MLPLRDGEDRQVNQHMIGNELREARERMGRSREDISRATKIPVRNISALEEHAFDRLPPAFISTESSRRTHVGGMR